MPPPKQHTSPGLQQGGTHDCWQTHDCMQTCCTMERASLEMAPSPWNLGTVRWWHSLRNTRANCQRGKSAQEPALQGSPGAARQSKPLSCGVVFTATLLKVPMFTHCTGHSQPQPAPCRKRKNRLPCYFSGHLLAQKSILLYLNSLTAEAYGSGLCPANLTGI